MILDKPFSTQIYLEQIMVVLTQCLYGSAQPHVVYLETKELKLKNNKSLLNQVQVFTKTNFCSSHGSTHGDA